MSRIYCMINFTLTEKDEVISANNEVKTAIIAVDDMPDNSLCIDIAKLALDKIKKIYADKTVNYVDYNILGYNVMFIN